MDDKTGGPAFPGKEFKTEKINDGIEGHPIYRTVKFMAYTPGMTLRDWFAGMALQGMMSNGFMPRAAKNELDEWNWAQASYRLADAMLKERES